MRTIFRHEGVRGLTAGLETALLALSPNWAVYWVAYNQFKTVFARDFHLKEGPILHMAAACCGGWITDAFCQPLWLIRARLMTQTHLRASHPPSAATHAGQSAGGISPEGKATADHITTKHRTRYRGTVHALRSIVREEGFATLYHGLPPQLLWNSLTLSIQFPVYERLKRYFAEHNAVKANLQHEGSSLAHWQYIVSSAAAKMLATTCTYPLEVLRTRQQIAAPGKMAVTVSVADSTAAAVPLPSTRRLGMLALARHMYAHEGGWHTFYRGLSTNLLRVVPGAAITFTVYEVVETHLKSLMHPDVSST